MEPDAFGNEPGYLWGESAMHPIAPRWTRHAALLVLAHGSAPFPLAVPGTPVGARSGAFNYRL